MVISIETFVTTRGKATQQMLVNGSLVYLQAKETLSNAGIYGLGRYPGDGFPGRVEMTVGRSNVNLTPNQVSWAFTLFMMNDNNS